MNQIPNTVNQKIKSMIHARLHPNKTQLIMKVFIIHLITALITLSLCPQFGFKLFKLPINLMYSFMVFGMPVCNFLCGLFFTATSMIVAAVALKRDEIRVLRYQKTLTTSILILSSIGFFSIMNPNLFLEFSLLWLVGAIVGIVLTLEVSSRILSQN